MRSPAARALAVAGGLLAVLGCSDDATLGTLEAEAVFAPAALDFGAVRVGSGKAEEVVLRNGGGRPLDIAEVALGPDFALRRLASPLEETTLGPGQSVRFDVVFQPTVEGTVGDRLEVRDAARAFTLPLTGEGTAGGAAALRLDPARLDFGVLVVGMPARRTVRVVNEGAAAAVIGRVENQDGADPRVGGAFRLEGPEPIEVPAGGSTALTVAFTPERAGAVSDAFLLRPVGRAEPLTLDLSGDGSTQLGDLQCATPVDFGALERGAAATAAALCTASGGPVEITGLGLRGEGVFRLVGDFDGSVNVASGQTVELPIEFSAQGTLGPVTGELQVAFQGGRGPGQARIALRGQVSEPSSSATALTLELTWNTGGTDLDLHLTAPGGAPVTSPREQAIEDLDCSYGDLAQYGGARDDWGEQGDPSDDCYLDRDDVDGLGPERINMSRAAPGLYRVYVHYFANNTVGATRAEVDVSLGGQNVGRFGRDGLRCNELWYVGDIDWTGSTGSFRLVDRVSPDDGGQCF